ncbi:MAG: flagellar motor protein MotB [Bacteroidetes bacterium]|nr:flagellar motor protein MotB [Bacteroidota bacterium]
MEEEDDEPSAPFWMATFSDMATILLTFFVMIVAMSEVEVKKFKAALSYFQGSTGILEHDAATPAIQAPMRENLDQVTAEDLERYEEVLRYIEAQNLEDKVEIFLTDRGMHVVITDSVMFSTGSAELIEPSRSILALVSQVLQEGVESVIVEGHTDDRSIATKVFPSNWELSTARASAVVRFLSDLDNALPDSQYVSIGYGEFRPIATNRTSEGRAKNRRVEILFSWEPWINQATHNLPIRP